MKKMLIVGAGGLGRMVLEIASKKYKCYFIDDAISDNSKVCGTPIIGKISDLSNFIGEYKYLICAIGNNNIREKVICNALKIGYIVPNIICDSAYISNYSQIGFGNIILHNVCVQNGSILGNGIVITANSEIHHDCKIGDFSLIYSCSVIRTNARVGTKTKIGSNVTICNDAIIKDCEEVKDGEVRR